MQPINDNDLLLIQETQKIACPESWYNKENIDASSSKDASFLQDVFQMIVIVLVSVMNHYPVYKYIKYMICKFK